MSVVKERAGGPRKGKAPREPRQRASEEPTAGLPGTFDRRELGAEDEELAEAVAAPGAASSSSSSGARPASSSGAQQGGAEGAVRVDPAAGGAQQGGAAASSSSGGRGPGQEPRERRVWQD